MSGKALRLFKGFTNDLAFAERSSGVHSSFTRCQAYATSKLLSQKQAGLDNAEVEAIDPFLSKLQQQTEASYLELLKRKDDVPDTEDEKREEELEEV